MRHLVVLLPLLTLLTACSSGPKSTPAVPQDNAVKGGFLLTPAHSGQPLGGDFANNPNTARFIDKMVREHGFDRQQLHDVLAQARRLDSVLRLMDRQAPTPSTQGPTGPNGSWLRYRNKFITPDNVQNGVQFWNQYQDALQRAYQVYGVPPEIIVGIIGVETRWGRVMGKTRIIDALATLAFDYPRRADYFAGELETFLLMSRTEGMTRWSCEVHSPGQWVTVSLCRLHSRAMRLTSTVTATSTCGIRWMPSAALPTTLKHTVGPRANPWQYRQMARRQGWKMGLKPAIPSPVWRRPG